MALQLPGIAVAQPGVRVLDLPAVSDTLIEDPKLITNAVADRRDLKGCISGNDLRLNKAIANC